MTYNDDVWEIEVRKMAVDTAAYVDILIKNKVSLTMFDDAWFISTINDNRDRFVRTIRNKIQQRYKNET